MQQTDIQPESGVELTEEMREETRLARRFFSQLERMSTLLSSYPDGHPVVMQSVTNAYDALYEFFELTDRLTVQVNPHSMMLSSSDKLVWETEDPRDFCFMLSRDGVFLIHLLAGLERHELRRFIEILNQLIDPANLHADAADLLFDANFSYLAFEAIDESLAALAGVDADIRDRDTVEEREMIEELFNEAFRSTEELQEVSAQQSTMDDHFQIRIQMHQERRRKLQIGSRQFLTLDEQAQRHLEELKRGFTEHRELEHREGEILSALLGARPRPQLRRESVIQIGEVMGTLLESDEPWEALSFLKIIHAWRDRFDPEVSTELISVVRDCFTRSRLNTLIKMVATGDITQRRAVLQMFDALHLNRANPGIAIVLGWELADDARRDIMAYLKKQAGLKPDFLREALSAVPEDQFDTVLDLVVDALPRTRSILLEQLNEPEAAANRAKILRALRGSWKDVAEIREQLIPLLDEEDSEVQLEALRSFCEAAPQHVNRVVAPMIDDRLRKRPEEEVREMVDLFVRHGGAEATKHLDSLIRRRGVVGASEQELAVEIARALIRSRTPAVVELLQSIAKDWLVPKRIRSTCKEVADLLSL